MPWCDDCERFSNPNSLGEDGSCPHCGSVIADGASGQDDPAGGEEATGSALASVPWHFWLLLAALVLYLGWRLVEGVGWLVGRF